METPIRMGNGANLYLPNMSWLQDATPMVKTPRTPQRSRSHTPDPNSSSIVNPSSALLQDLLKEQRASRGARTGGLEELEESPQRTPEWCHSQSLTNSQDEPGSEKQQTAKLSSNGSVRRPPEMGVRETDQVGVVVPYFLYAWLTEYKYISKISKQNFDLKLEIFHRVQQLSVLEKKLERMQELEDELERMRGLEDEVQELRAAEEDNQRLRESNEQLRQEIDKRDQAVTEAVELICQLEARVEELEKENPRSSTTHHPYVESGVATPRNTSTPDIPERTSSRRGIRHAERRRVSSGSRSLQRAPSFLLEDSKSTAALRSLYAETDDTPISVPTPITKSESMNSMAETAEPESPRLSALSECSELNIDDTLVSGNGFDQIDIPVRRQETSTQATNLSSVTLRMSDADTVRVDQWVPEEMDDTSKGGTTRRRDVFKESQASSPSSSSRKSKLESIFGSARLPPTPDTMTTAYPAWANSSSNSTIADKSQSDLRRCLTRTRSADELTARRGSITMEPRESMDSNVSKVTFPRASLDDRDEDPAIFPLSSIQQPRYDPSANHGIFAGDFDRVLARMNKDYYCSSRPTTRDELTSLGSSPLSMTAEDWIEAARPGTGRVPVSSRVVGAHAPSQSSFLGRRHSIDSAVREPTLPIIQTINPRALNDGDAPPLTAGPEPEARRRISLIPPFFTRSANARRLQPSPIPDPADKDDGAPSPVIRKTRNPPSRTHRPLSGVGQASEFSASSGPSYVEDGMSRSFTEANINSPSPSSTRPPTSNGGKDHHKRRGSLGIFGWMKGASAGLGSSLKKSDVSPQIQTSTTSNKPETQITAPPTVSTAPASASMTVRATSRLATHDNVTLAAKEPHSKPTESAAEELATFATRTRHPTRSDEPTDEHGRRPRYMERRSRRT
ncbi:hypothetical protein AN5575.2 [Aspergillus nidulans FGSC A4]|uniref:Uncharacterized protein n=1 Tax=Emericella nidulans (strain FGSC A4 / ATCC 38163 / CBS 112.46 / NRRL 194 / M139) TaxID=227321 RepID=Q5B1K5_EMENI|nr:hypothetical protein [Aspergillus nidulans FGSC A4]EAA62218.1 hypothetical protein AN5575.2 [Aspergillus nidulans FGSC A4]CBF81636.1 TPA: conserved hypothetical protein [Aspergillus nidulans FGSC A4]|eukprot:XP_663179.1 hypothetical protein AN5575.2 [Aspergillus nidulans FGSC A4]